MSEVTSTIRTSETLELQRLIRLIDSLEGQFRQQRAILQRRGMSLPPGTLSNLQKARTELETALQDYEEAAREVNRLRELGRMAELINSTLDLNDVLNEVMDTVIALTRAERGYLMLRNPQTGELEFTIARNIEHRTLMENEFIISRTIVTEVARSGVPIVRPRRRRRALRCSTEHRSAWAAQHHLRAVAAQRDGHGRCLRR